MFSVAYLIHLIRRILQRTILGSGSSPPRASILSGDRSWRRPWSWFFLEVCEQFRNYEPIDAFSDVNRDGVAVATPLPGALSLFASGAAMLGPGMAQEAESNRTRRALNPAAAGRPARCVSLAGKGRAKAVRAKGGPACEQFGSLMLREFMTEFFCRSRSMPLAIPCA